MQRLLAILLVLVGLIGLALGRLGETTWAPDTEATATAELNDPGPAVVIDPGVLYIGDETGEVSITGASDISVITAGPGDIEAYLDGVSHTRVTGASDWSTLSTEPVNPEGETELSSPTSSDLWRSVETAPSPYTLDIGEFRAGETGENEQPYRALLIVTDGTASGAETISITWPVEAENEWVPIAYAGGAAIAVIGLVLLVVSLGSGRRRDTGDAEENDPGADENAPRSEESAGLQQGADQPAAAPLTVAADEPETSEPRPDEPETSEPRPDEPESTEPRSDDTEKLDAVQDESPSTEEPR